MSSMGLISKGTMSITKQFNTMLTKLQNPMSLVNMISGGRGSISAGHHYTNKGKNNTASEKKPIRRIQPILLDDNKLEAEILKYIANQHYDSLEAELATFFPVPPYDSHLEDKFEYFYRPYNYEANTKKYISYEGENDPPGRINPFRVYEELLHEHETHFIEIYLRSLGKRSQSEPQREMQKELLQLQM